MRMFLTMILLGAAIPMALVAQNTQSDVAVGTWKMNVEKSTFTPGRGPKSITVMIGADKKVTVEEVSADGKTMNYSFTPSEGTAVPIDGMQDSTITGKKVDDHTVEHTWKIGDSTMTGMTRWRTWSKKPPPSS